MITTLTDTQIARFPEFIEKWTEHGLCTQPADRRKAEQGIRRAYETAHLTPPLKIVWTTSPLAQALTESCALQIQQGASIGASVRDRVGASVRARVRDSIGASVLDRVRDSVGASVRDRVGASVRDSVGASVDASVGASMLDRVGANVRTSVRDSVRASVGARVGDRVGDRVLDRVRDRIRTSVYDRVLDSVCDRVGASVRDRIRTSVLDRVLDRVYDRVRTRVGASVRDRIRTSVYDMVLASIGDRVGARVRARVLDSVYDRVRARVRDRVGASVLTSVGASVDARVLASVYNNYYWWFGNGQHDAPWCAYIDFFREVLGLTAQTEPSESHREIAESAGWFSPYQHLCWISERHRRVCRNSRGQLHSHDGMALEYPDGWGIWAWNGVCVTEQIILKPETLRPEQIAKEQNAQVRQVMVERIGIERVCQIFRAVVLDKKDSYELLNLNLGDGRIRPYLKMLNPSVGCYHIEGVPPTCTTVQQAINWRAGNEEVTWNPEILT